MTHQPLDQGSRDFVRFQWHRFTGYELSAAKWQREGTLLETVRVVRWQGKGTYLNSYFPLDEVPDIDLKFSKLKDENDVLAFASAYGVLGLTSRHLMDGHRLVPSGERVSEWLSEARSLRMCLAVWQALQRADSRALSLVFRPSEYGSESECREVWFEDAQVKDLPSGVGTQRRSYVKKEGILGWARILLVDVIGERLRGRTDPILLINSKNDFVQYERPSDLLAAIWIQLRRRIAGQLRTQLCGECQDLMDTSRNSAGKRFCDTCVLRRKMRNWRGAKKKAQEMCLAGSTVTAIAASMQRDKEIISNWVSPVAKVPTRGTHGDRRKRQNNTSSAKALR